MEWISAEDRMPEEDGDYLVFFPDGDIEVVYYSKKYMFHIYHSHMITHWMPLPDPPEDG